MAKNRIRQIEHPMAIHYLGDGSIGWLHHIAEEPNQRGVVGMRMYVEPTDPIRRHFHLRPGEDIDEEGLVNVWYPKSSTFLPSMAQIDRRWIYITSNFKGEGDAVEEKVNELRKRVAFLERENKRLTQELFVATGMAKGNLMINGDFIMRQADMVKKFSYATPQKDEVQSQEEGGDEHG